MEISSPAGSFSSAILALKNGADSIYFGLKMFSARAGADNFTIDDYRRIRKFAKDNGKKIYIAINTIITDSLLGSVYSLLKKIDFYGADGIIVQDWGVVNIIKKHFPNLKLHASTQMAVQNSDGVRVLKKLGFQRVVLARELALDEIENIRDENKDVELKVFVHGALCYCVSGLCFASKFLLGVGSANRGTCRQVCRMSFSNNGKSEPIYSLCDLASDKNTIKALERMGIDSIKIEGRLKGDSYSKWASAYYSAILNNKSDKEISECRERLMCAFSRKTTSGFLQGSSDIYLKDYIGHRGFLVAVADENGKFKLKVQMFPHDGVMLLTKKAEVFKNDFAIYANKGDELELKFGKYIPKEYDELYKIKDSRDNIESLSKDSFPLEHFALRINVKIACDKIEVSSQFKGIKVQKSYYIKTEPARTKQDTKLILTKAFSRQSEYFTLLSVSVEEKLKNPFLPSSVIKKIALDFYKLCDDRASEYFESGYNQKGCNFINDNATFKKKADIRLSPVVFSKSADEKEFFQNNSVEVNNISQLANILDEKGTSPFFIKPIVLGPYFNIANREAIDFFYSIFKNNLKGIFASPELESQELKDMEKYIICYVDYKNTLPSFIHRLPSSKDCVETYTKDLKR